MIPQQNLHVLPDISNGDLCPGSAILAVQHPVHLLFRSKAYGGCLELIHILVGFFPEKHVGYDIAQIHRCPGHPYKQHLKETVIESHRLVHQPLKPAYTDGIGHHAKGKILLQHLSVPLHLHMIWLQSCKGGSLHNIPGSQRHALWYSQAGGKVIGGSGRNIAQKRHFLKLHHSGYGFIEGAVSAAAHHHIHLFTQPGHHFHGILLLLGNVDTKLISGLGENIQYFHQLSLDLFLTGTGIEYKQHFFHPAFLPFSVTIFVNLIQ